MVEDILILCGANTARTVPAVKKARTKYDSGRRFDGYETKDLLVHCEPYHMEFDRRQNIRAKFFDKKIQL